MVKAIGTVYCRKIYHYYLEKTAMKSLLEEMGDTYHEENDYLIPNLVLSAEKEMEIGL